MSIGHDSISVLIGIDIFARGILLGENGGTALHINLVKISVGIFMNGVAILMEFLFLGNVTESFLMLLKFSGRIGDEIGFECIGRKYFFV